MPQRSEQPEPIEVFYSYSHKDEKLRNMLDTHLSLLQRQGIISEWNDRMIEAGDDWESEISEHLNSARIILLLVSADFLASDYCYSIEMKRALERHKNGEALAIPVILRPVDWESSPLGKLQALPKDAKPVIEWKPRDAAFKNIAQGVRRKIKNFKPEQPPTPTSSYIPRPPIIGFVARRDEDGRDIVERLQEELAQGKNQLVTLSGPGGVGKTTLAAEAARTLEKTYQGRFVWSDVNARASYTLSTLLDDIATQLGQPNLRTLKPEDKEAQIRALVVDPPALVVVDNYETISPPEQQAIETWFEHTNCSALITSRQRINKTLNIAINAMPPDEAEEFLNRLVRQTQDAEIFSEDVRQRIYETAEANPFVMEWVVAQIDEAKEPQTVFRELSQGEGDAAQRVFDRSFNLPQLGDDGRSVLLALSLFTPSASREALAAVAGFADEPKRIDKPLKNLHALSLIKGLNQHSRFTIEGLTRTLAGARLSKDARAEEFKERFIKYFRSYAEEYEHPTPEAYNMLEPEKDNLLKAMDMSLASGGLESVIRMTYILAAPVSGMLSVRGYWDDAIQYLEQALQASRNTQMDIRVANFAHNVAMMYQRRGDFAKARLLYDESLEIKKRFGDQSSIAITLHQLGWLAQEQGEVEEARRLYNESLEIKKKLDNQSGIAITLHQLGRIAQEQGEVEEARQLYTESLEISKRLGDQISIAGTLHNLAEITRQQGEIEEARRLYNQSLDIAKSLGDQSGIASTLHQLGRVAEKQGDLVEAERLMSEALSIFERLNSPYASVAHRNLKRIRGES